MDLTSFYRGLKGILRRDTGASRVKEPKGYGWEQVIVGDEKKPDTWLARIPNLEANKPYGIVVECYSATVADAPLTQDELREDTLAAKILKPKLNPQTHCAMYDTRLMLKIGEMPEGTQFKPEDLDPDIVVLFLNGEMVYGYTRVRGESYHDIHGPKGLKYFRTMNGFVNFVISNFMIDWNSFRSMFNDPKLPQQKLEKLIGH